MSDLEQLDNLLEWLEEMVHKEHEKSTVATAKVEAFESIHFKIKYLKLGISPRTLPDK